MKPQVCYMYSMGVQYGALFLWNNCRMTTVAPVGSVSLYAASSLITKHVYCSCQWIFLYCHSQRWMDIKVYHQRPAAPTVSPCGWAAGGAARVGTVVSSWSNTALYYSSVFDVCVLGDWEPFQIALRWMSTAVQWVRASPHRVLAEQNKRAEEGGEEDQEVGRAQPPAAILCPPLSWASWTLHPGLSILFDPSGFLFGYFHFLCTSSHLCCKMSSNWGLHKECNTLDSY